MPPASSLPPRSPCAPCAFALAIAWCCLLALLRRAWKQANRLRIEFAKGIPLAELEVPDAPEPSGAEAPEQEVA